MTRPNQIVFQKVVSVTAVLLLVVSDYHGIYYVAYLFAIVCHRVCLHSFCSDVCGEKEKEEPQSNLVVWI